MCKTATWSIMGEEAMIIDKYTKAIMTVIAVALFITALKPVDTIDMGVFTQEMGTIAFAMNHIDCSR